MTFGRLEPLGLGALISECFAYAYRNPQSPNLPCYHMHTDSAHGYVLDRSDANDANATGFKIKTVEGNPYMTNDNLVFSGTTHLMPDVGRSLCEGVHGLTAGRPPQL